MNYAKKPFKSPAQNQSEQNGTSGNKSMSSSSWRVEKKEELFDRVLVAVGRTPNSDNLGLETPKLRSTKRTSFR